MDGTYLLPTIFNKFSFGHRVCLELACKTNRFEVFHFFAPTYFANPWVVQVVSHVWVVISRIVKLFVCMCRVGGQFSVLFVPHHVSSSIRAGDQSLMRVLLRFWRDGREPPLVLPGIVVSRLYMSSGGLAVGFAGKDCSPTSCAVAEGICPFPLWLQAALWAEVCPADTQRIEGLNGQVVSAARFAPQMQLPLVSARLTSKHFITSLCRDDTKFSEMLPQLDECVRRLQISARTWLMFEQ